MPRPCLPMSRLVQALACAALLVQAVAVAAGAAAPRRDVPALTAAVEEVESLVHSAWFEKAIRLAEETRGWAGDVPRSPQAKELRARLEVLLCTAQVALGQHADARRSMGRAVYVWPLLRLDESNTSPRVVEIFREVRGRGGARSAR